MKLGKNGNRSPGENWSRENRDGYEKFTFKT